MKKINVQILFSQKEYDKLKKEADKFDLTIPLYIKKSVLKDDDFGNAYKKLLDKVEALPRGTRFTIKSLFGVEWTMNKGTKLSLGKQYFKRVDSGVINNSKAIGKDSSNIMWYEKL